MRNYASSILKKKTKLTSNLEFPFICVINTMCHLRAIFGDNNTSVNKGKPMLLLCCHFKPLLVLSLILTIASYIFHSHFFSDKKFHDQESTQNAEYEK